MSKSKFYDKIKSAVIERQVEDVYNEGINLYFDGKITYPFGCDGFLDTKYNGKMLKLIIEYKLDELMKNCVVRAKVICQVVFYLKRFENNGLILPTVCMVGDKNECFVMHTNDLLKYLDEDIDWNIAPSEAHKYCYELVAKIAADENINPFVFDIDENFSFKETVAKKIVELAEDVQRYVHVCEHNLATIFDYFTKNVIINAKKIQANDLVAIFMGVITEHENYYIHPVKKNILVTPSGEIAVNGKGFKSFFSHFDRKYTPQEKNKFAEISDRLIEDTKRRNTGEFYTPTLFVDYAHKMLAERFGEDWKKKYVVWDNCCGTKNLTRDYPFTELYCSTLENAELEISKRYNPEATAFQFDFLNDDLSKLPEGLRYSFEYNKPVIFLINPPYATANNMGANGTSKEGIAKTKINEQMLSDGIGASCQNLYAQFLYRIVEIKKQYNLTNCHIALFSPTLFLTGTAWKGFRKYFFNDFSFDNAVQFKASEFADVSDNWGISFSIWSNGINTEIHDFNYLLIENIEGEIVSNGSKIVYNIDNQLSANEWAKKDVKGVKAFDAPQISSGVKIKEKGVGTITPNAIGYFASNSNNVDMNTQFVAMYSGASSRAHGYSITESNFTRCTALFSARKLIEKNWVNSKDEYLAPNEEHPAYKEFENDSIVYSLFHSASNQSSLRAVDYKGKKWDIKNEFFFMGKDEIAELANENCNDETYYDCKNSEERYVYTLLKGLELSEEAQAVLNKAKEIVRKTFKNRSLFNEEHPEYQINNWDCGWYQIKALAKEYASEDYKEFVELYKKLADKMRPMVYELGFLK